MNQEMENFKGQVEEIIKNAVSYVRPDEIDKIVEDLQNDRNIFIRLMPICRGDHRLVAQLDQQLRELEVPQKQQEKEEMITEEEISPTEDREPTQIGGLEAYYGIDHTLCLKMTSDLRMQGQISQSDLDMVWESGRVQEMVLGTENVSLEVIEAKKQAFFDILKQYVKSLAEVEALQEINYIDMLKEAMDEIAQEKEVTLTEEQKVTANVLDDVYQDFRLSLETFRKDDGSNQELLAFITSLKTLESNCIHLETYSEQERAAILGVANLSLEDLNHDLTNGRKMVLTRLQQAANYLKKDLNNLDALANKGIGFVVFDYNLKNLNDSYLFLTEFYNENMLEQMLAEFNINLDDDHKMNLMDIRTDIDKAELINTYYKDMERRIHNADFEMLGILELLKSRNDVNQRVLKELEFIFEDHRKNVQDENLDHIKERYIDFPTEELLSILQTWTLTPDRFYDVFLTNIENLGLNIDKTNENVLMNEDLKNVYDTIVEAYEQLAPLAKAKEKEPIKDEKEDSSKVPSKVEEDIVSTIDTTIDVIDVENPKYQAFLQEAATKKQQLDATKFRKLKIPTIVAFNIFSKKRKEMKKYNTLVDSYNDYQKAYAYTETYGQYFDLSEKDQIEVEKGKDVLEAWKHDLEEMSEKYEKYLVHGNTPKLEESKETDAKPIKLPEHAVEGLKYKHAKNFDAEVEQMKEDLQTKEDVELIKESQKLSEQLDLLEKENKELLNDQKVDLLELVSLVATYKSKEKHPSEEIRAISKDAKALFEEMIAENEEKDVDADIKIIEEQIDGYQNSSLEEIEQLILEENKNLQQTCSNLHKNKQDQQNIKFLNDLALHTAIKQGAKNDFKDFSDEDKKYIHSVKTFDSDFSKFVNKYAQNKLDVYMDENGKTISEEPVLTKEEPEVQTLDSEVTIRVTEIEKNTEKESEQKELSKEELEAIRAYLHAQGSNLDEMIAAGNKLREAEAQVEQELKEGRSK